MKSSKLSILGVLALIVVVLVQPLTGQTPTTITVQVNQPRAKTTPKQYGIFFEDINFGADGGVYAELIKNNSFEFPVATMGWSQLNAQGSWRVMERETANTNNRHYVQLQSNTAGYAISNNGFRGIGVRQGEEYLLTLHAQNSAAAMPLRVSLVGANEKLIAQGSLTVNGGGGDWKVYRLNLRANATESKAQLRLTLERAGTVSVDLVSLFPKNTWKARSHGWRNDLVQLLADLKPGFLRFPGGCIVEGRELATRYQWKTTLGEPAERKLIINRWNTEFKTRNPERAPDDYFQSFGMGFFEYFQLAEDIGAEPLPIINCGMACQFNTGELVPLDQLDPYIQDALDLIEFANGAVTTTWGRKRAELGHPAPFNLKMMGIGNEQWGKDYIPRFERFARAIKAKYPNVTLVTSAGPFPSGEQFDFLWGQFRKLNNELPSLVDEHYYRPPQWFLDNANRYNDYPRTGPSVFAGEYAAHVTVPQGRKDRPNNWEGALTEAAFLTGLDRNSDLVKMASYAPLFAHVDAWQWSPNLIWFDNLRSFGTPSYYVQKLFSTNQGTDILPLQINGSALNGQQKVYASALMDARTNTLILKLVNVAATQTSVRLNLAGAPPLAKTGQQTVLASNDLTIENTLDAPQKLVPTTQAFNITGADFSRDLPAQSVTVLRLPFATKR